MMLPRRTCGPERNERPPAWAHRLPEHRHVVLPDPLVVGDDRGTLSSSLRDQEPVEWVAVMRRELLDRASVFEADGEWLRAAVEQERQVSLVDRQLPDRTLDRYLPDNDRAEQHLVAGVLQCSRSAGAKPRIVLEKGHCGVRVEQ